ncbi:hypothetical protein OHA72_53795 [Dactylosporangium sp. NBC_01737]|nr:hypothetical protein OHA72_53795 [Dactylosporangium sp. NBC_01737]
MMIARSVPKSAPVKLYRITSCPPATSRTYPDRSWLAVPAPSIAAQNDSLAILSGTRASVAWNESVSPDCGPSCRIAPSGEAGWLKKMKYASSESLLPASSPKHETSQVSPGPSSRMPT